MGLFKFLVDKQSPWLSPWHKPSQGCGCFAMQQCSPWVVEQWGRMGEQGALFQWHQGTGQGWRHLSLLVHQPPSHCWARPATPGTLYVPASSQMTIKKNQNLKIPRPNSSLWAALAQRGKSSCSWTLYPFAKIYVSFVQMPPRKACSISLGSCAPIVSLEMYQ